MRQCKTAINDVIGHVALLCACEGRHLHFRSPRFQSWVDRLRYAAFAAVALLALIANFVSPAKADPVTSYQDMIARIDSDCAKSPLIRVAALGRASSGERTVWMVRVADPSEADIPRRVLILCRQHGDEPVNTEAALNILDQIADGQRPDIVHDLQKTALYIVPMVNPDGAEAGTRESGAGADLNRDWGPFREPETRAVYDAFLKIRPQVVLDMHSWDEGDPFRGYCLEAPREGVAGDPMLSQAARDLQLRGSQALLAKTGQAIAVTNYGETADTTLCHRFFLEKADTVALLFETQPDNGGQPFTRRIAVAQAAITWLAGDVADQPGWKAVASREAHDVKVAALGESGPADRIEFLANAREEPVAAGSPLRAAAAFVRRAARRVPRAVWWALAVYVLLCIARPIFTPPAGSGATAVDTRRTRRSRIAGSQKGRSTKRA